MAGFVEGVDRGQSTLFPALQDDYVAEDNPVCVVEGFVDGLDLDKLGFVGVQPVDTGRPGCHPGMMLKLWTTDLPCTLEPAVSKIDTKPALDPLVEIAGECIRRAFGGNRA
jgi:hypothetical protein